MDMDNKENLSAEQDKQLIVYSSATNQIVWLDIMRIFKL